MAPERKKSPPRSKSKSGSAKPRGPKGRAPAEKAGSSREASTVEAGAGRPHHRGGIMATATLDPRIESLKKQFESAFAGGKGPEYKDFAAADVAHSDATMMASTMLAAYQVGAKVNPSKAFKAKDYKPAVRLSDSSVLANKAWWNDVFDVIEVIGPVVVNALSKDYQPQPPMLADVIQRLPPERRNDKDFVDYATSLLLALAQTTVQALDPQKAFSNGGSARYTIPDPPPGKDKGWFDDVCDFVSDAAPVAVPIILSLL
jgi:hypothetical protein